MLLTERSCPRSWHLKSLIRLAIYFRHVQLSRPAVSLGGLRCHSAFRAQTATTFLKALHRVYALFGDGEPRKTPRAAAAKKIKDNGIDIIAWKRSIDDLPCTLYLIAQVASGKDWQDKSVTTGSPALSQILVH